MKIMTLTFLLLLSVNVFSIEKPVYHKYYTQDKIVEFENNYKIKSEKFKFDKERFDLNKALENSDKLIKKLNYRNGNYIQRIVTISFLDKERNYAIIKINYFNLDQDFSDRKAKDISFDVLLYPDGVVLPHRILERNKQNE